MPPDEEMRSPSAMLEVGSVERGQSAMERVRVCFSCGRPGHGMNWCSWVDTSFPFLPQGWSVDIRDGQYRVTQTGGARTWSPPGNEGWSGREGQPPGSSGTKIRLTPAGDSVDQGEASRHGICRWGVGLDLIGLRARTLFCHWGAIPHKYMGRITESCQSWPSRCWEEGV